MARDLAQERKQVVAAGTWEGFFTGRPHYAVVENPAGDGLQALYENPDTEVHFAFGWTAQTLGFSLPAGVPRPFALEAEVELTAFAARFGAFERGAVAIWEQARQGLKGRAASAALPGAFVEQIWRWNFARHTLAASLELFVPGVRVARVGRQLKTFVVWSPEEASALPKVDLFWVGGERLVPVATIAAQLEAFPSRFADGDALPFWRVGEAGRPEGLMGVIERVGRGKKPVEVSFGKVKEKWVSGEGKGAGMRRG